MSDTDTKADTPVADEAATRAPDGKPDESIDFDERELCPDGSCVGVIGDDGRCKVCGRAGERRSVGAAERVGGGHEPEQTEDGDGDGEPPASDEDRQLCPDGNCVGLIGAEGRCKVCGLPADAAV